MSTVLSLSVGVNCISRNNEQYENIAKGEGHRSCEYGFPFAIARKYMGWDWIARRSGVENYGGFQFYPMGLAANLLITGFCTVIIGFVCERLLRGVLCDGPVK
jgi:hypothetical protein